MLDVDTQQAAAETPSLNSASKATPERGIDRSGRTSTMQGSSLRNACFFHVFLIMHSATLRGSRLLSSGLS